MLERLQKVISQSGIASRRQAEKLILEGRVSLNGKTVTELGTKVAIGRDKVRIDGKLIESEKLIYLLFYKPKGVVTTLHDPQGRKNIKEFIKEIPQRVYPVGRLDYNTEGLLLLTNDGELTHSLIHPSKKVDKVYLARVVGRPPEEKLDLLRAGIQLEDGVTSPAIIKQKKYDKDKNETLLEITIHEGKNRQIRRMCETIGHPVNQLKRIQFAFLTLEGLKRGRYRQLSSLEVEELKAMTKNN